ISLNSFYLQRAIHEFGFIQACSTRNRKRVLNAGGTIFPITVVEILASLRVLRFNHYAVCRVGDFNSHFGESLWAVSALHRVYFYFVTIPGADANIAVDVRDADATGGGQRVSL